MALLIRIGLLAALLCSPLLLVLPGGWRWALIPLWLVAFSLLAGALNKHFNSIYRLRYLEGRADAALRKLALWRLLVSESQFAGIQVEALCQAGRLSQAEGMTTRKSLPAWQREHCAFVLARYRRDYAAADGALERLLTLNPPEDQRVGALADRSRLLAEFMPDRMNEARQLAEQAGQGQSTGPMRSLVRGCQGIVEVASGVDVEAGIGLLRQACEELGTHEVLALPFVAEFHRWMGRGYQKLGQLERAREELITARTLTRLPMLIEDVEADLKTLSR